MIVDGNSLAHRLFDDLKDRVAALPKSPRLTVLTCAPNFETQKFLTIKRKQAERLGIQVNIVELQEDIDTEECVDAIADAVRTSDGIVVQLPFPVHVERSTLIAAIPNSHDVDAFNLDDPEILPPVVGAIKEILISEGIDVVRDRRVVVVGNGALVGMPAATWFRKNGALVESVTLASTQITEKTKGADIIVLGAGSPHLLTPEMIKAFNIACLA